MTVRHLIFLHDSFYCTRPASPAALHGHGPTLLAGAEILKPIANPALEVQYKVCTYHYVPKSAGGAK